MYQQELTLGANLRHKNKGYTLKRGELGEKLKLKDEDKLRNQISKSNQSV